MSNINFRSRRKKSKNDMQVPIFFLFVDLLDFIITVNFANTTMAKRVTMPDVIPILTSFTANVVPKRLPKVAN